MESVFTPNQSDIIERRHWHFIFPNFSTFADSIVVHIPELGKRNVHYPVCNEETLTVLQREACRLSVKNIFKEKSYKLTEDPLTNTWTWEYDIELSDF